MKKTSTSIFLLLFVGIAVNVFSQEWKWRETLIRDIKQRTLQQSDYSQTIFTGKVDFRKTTFAAKADFNQRTIDSLANFKRAVFDKDANFYATVFIDTADFSFAKFSNAVFKLGNFNANANFEKAEFDLIATFSERQFNANANFIKAEFDSTALFIKTIFNSDANFSNGKFNSYVSFKSAQFMGDTYFQGDTLPEYLDFSNVTKTKYEIDLTKSIINPKYKTCNINLTDAAIDKFRFSYKRFKLWFPVEDATGYDLKANVYEELLKKQKDEGFTQSYEILDKEYREFQYTDPGAEKGEWGKFLNWVEKNWWGYGYDKELIIRNALIIFLILSFINSFFLKYLITQVYSNEKISKLIEKRETKNGFIKWFDSLRYSIFYTAVIFFSFNFDMEKLNYAGNLDGWKVLNLTWFMLIYLGGVVCMAYLANFIISV